MDLTAIIAIWGAVTGTVGATWHIYSLFRERPDVDVKVSWGVLTDGLGRSSDTQIFVEAINKGRHPVTLTGVGFKPSARGYQLVLTPQRLPYELTEGKNHQEWFPLEELAGALSRRHLTAAPGKAWYQDATGRRWTGQVPKDIRKGIEEAARKLLP